jgi:hypothetical protein
MKKFLLTFLLLLLPLMAEATVVKLVFEWDANTESDLAGYRLFDSNQQGGPYTQVLQVGRVTTCEDTIEIDPGQTVYYVLRAFDTAGNESGNSNEVAFFLSETTPGVGPKPPTFRLKSSAVVSSNP